MRTGLELPGGGKALKHKRRTPSTVGQSRGGGTATKQKKQNRQKTENTTHKFSQTLANAEKRRRIPKFEGRTIGGNRCVPIPVPVPVPVLVRESGSGFREKISQVASHPLTRSHGDRADLLRNVRTADGALLELSRALQAAAVMAARDQRAVDLVLEAYLCRSTFYVWGGGQEARNRA